MKICVMHTGGTIAMERKPGTNTYEVSANRDRILELVPELKKIAEIDFVFLFHKDSAHFTHIDWVRIGKEIYDRYYDYDGFVIIHGTDTMAYTASALSFMLQGLGKPVVLTGSQVPLSEPGSVGRVNLINAVRLASMDIAEVCILFGAKIIRGTRAKKIGEFDVQSFASVNFPELGEIGLDIELFDYEEKRHTGSIIFLPHFEPNAALIKLYPGMAQETLAQNLKSVKGAVIEAYGAGNIPAEKENNLIPAIEAAARRGTTIVIGTQCVSGSSDYERYVGDMRAKVRGAISAFDMTSECALVKLMWVLGATNNAEEIKGMYSEEVVGEMKPAAVFSL